MKRLVLLTVVSSGGDYRITGIALLRRGFLRRRSVWMCIYDTGHCKEESSCWQPALCDWAITYNRSSQSVQHGVSHRARGYADRPPLAAFWCDPDRSRIESNRIEGSAGSNPDISNADMMNPVNFDVTNFEWTNRDETTRWTNFNSTNADITNPG